MTVISPASIAGVAAGRGEKGGGKQIVSRKIPLTRNSDDSDSDEFQDASETLPETVPSIKVA
jgi:hypothetical protein